MCSHLVKFDIGNFSKESRLLRVLTYGINFCPFCASFITLYILNANLLLPSYLGSNSFQPFRRQRLNTFFTFQNLWKSRLGTYTYQKCSYYSYLLVSVQIWYRYRYLSAYRKAIILGTRLWMNRGCESHIHPNLISDGMKSFEQPIRVLQN